MPWSVWQVTEYEEGRSFTWALRLAPGMRATGGHQVTADGDGTTAEFRLESGGSLGRLLGPVLGRTVFSRNTRNATEGLKNYLERRGSASGS